MNGDEWWKGVKHHHRKWHWVEVRSVNLRSRGLNPGHEVGVIWSDEWSTFTACVLTGVGCPIMLRDLAQIRSLCKEVALMKHNMTPCKVILWTSRYYNIILSEGSGKILLAAKGAMATYWMTFFFLSVCKLKCISSKLYDVEKPSSVDGEHIHKTQGSEGGTGWFHSYPWDISGRRPDNVQPSSAV